MSQVKQAHIPHFQPLPAMDLKHSDFLRQNSLDLLHFQSGPISAPAAPSTGDDYFSFQLPSQSAAGVEKNRPSHQHEHTGAGSQYAPPPHQPPHINLWKPHSPVVQKNRGHLNARQRISSDKRIRHKSRLSNSITHDGKIADGDESSPAVLSYSSESNNQDNEQLKSKSPAKRKNNPGFRIPLDNLQPSNPVSHFQQPTHIGLGAVGSIGSESNLDLTYQNMKISDPDVYFHRNGGEWDSGQENVTPLMNPPATNELGYFGAFEVPVSDKDASFNALDTGMPSGYLSLPRDAERSSVTKSDDNSTDFDEFAAIPFDSFVPIQESFDDFSLSVTNFENQFDELGFSHQHPSHTLFDSGGHVPVVGEYLQHAQRHSHSNLHLNQHSHSQLQSHAPQSQLRNLGSEQVSYPPRAVNQLDVPNAMRHTGYNSTMQYGNQDHYQLFKADASPKPRSLFVSRPILERSQSAQSAVPPVIKSEVKKKKKSSRVVICPICEKHISRDFTRHARIHNEVGRFQCVFPRNTCSHKSGKFNRPYDYKKHLLNVHFTFDDPKIRLAPNLKGKLLVYGLCNSCGQRFLGNDWLEEHVLNTDKGKRCQKLQTDIEVDQKALHATDNLEEDNFALFIKEENLD